jgi:hypothetical protein
MFKEITEADGYISDGETVAVWFTREGAVYQKYAETVFHWPVLDVRVAFPDGTQERFYMELIDAHYGWARLEQRKVWSGGGCAIIYEEPKPRGFVPRGL